MASNVLINTLIFIMHCIFMEKLISYLLSDFNNFLLQIFLISYFLIKLNKHMISVIIPH